MTKKPEWQIERDKEKAVRQKGLQSLTLEQIQSVHATYEALNSTILSIRDLNDIMLSDIKALDEACCDLHHQFNLRGDDD
jgi:hypothetical protein